MCDQYFIASAPFGAGDCAHLQRSPFHCGIRMPPGALVCTLLLSPRHFLQAQHWRPFRALHGAPSSEAATCQEPSKEWKLQALKGWAFSLVISTSVGEITTPGHKQCSQI